jgi:hypothetical protein
LQALANSFEGNVTGLKDVNQKGSRLRERCNSEGRISIDGKLQTIQQRWSDLNEKISQKLQMVKHEISEWTFFNKDLDDKLTELRNYEISLSAQIIGVSDLKTLEKELADVKVYNVPSQLKVWLNRPIQFALMLFHFTPHDHFIEHCRFLSFLAYASEEIKPILK